MYPGRRFVESAGKDKNNFSSMPTFKNLVCFIFMPAKKEMRIPIFRWRKGLIKVRQLTKSYLANTDEDKILFSLPSTYRVQFHFRILKFRPLINLTI